MFVLGGEALQHRKAIIPETNIILICFKADDDAALVLKVDFLCALICVSLSLFAVLRRGYFHCQTRCASDIRAMLRGH